MLLQIFQNWQEKTCDEIGAPQHLSTILLKLVENLFLEPFFISLDKSILLHPKCLMSKFSGILETFPKLLPLMYELVCSLLTWHFLIGNIFVQSWLIWTTFHTATIYQNVPLLGYDLKNILQNTLQKCRSSRSQIFYKIVILKLHAWRPGTLFKKRTQHKSFPVNIIKCINTAFFMEHLLVICKRKIGKRKICISVL